MPVDVTVHSHKQTDCPVEISVADSKGHVVGSHQHVADKPFKFTVPSPKLWSPDTPTLYNVTVKMGDDEIKSYTGFRTISSGVVNGIKRPLLNGEFIFMFGPLDQGYWPDGLHTPPSVPAMVYDLEVIKGLGMNMVRKHVSLGLSWIWLNLLADCPPDQDRTRPLLRSLRPPRSYGHSGHAVHACVHQRPAHRRRAKGV